MKKSNKPSGVSLSPEFKEVIKRLKDKKPELDAIIEKNGEPNPEKAFDYLREQDRKKKN